MEILFNLYHRIVLVWFCVTGGDGRKGRVIEVQDWNASQPGSGVMVEWDKGYKNMYRLGYQGKVRASGILSVWRMSE